MRLLSAVRLSLLAANRPAQATPITGGIRVPRRRRLYARIAQVTPKVVACRRDLHPRIAQLTPKVVACRRDLHAQPCRSVDPIAIGAQISSAVPTIVSRNINLTASPAELTLGAFNGDLRKNIIAETAPSTSAKDSSPFLERVPGLLFFPGVTPVGKNPLSMPTNHSPRYDADEAASPTSATALSALVTDALMHGVTPPRATK